MTLHRWHDDNGYDNPSVYCDDQKLLLGHIRRYLPRTSHDIYCRRSLDFSPFEVFCEPFPYAVSSRAFKRLN